jgi:site-specific DNA recombinase
VTSSGTRVVLYGRLSSIKPQTATTVGSTTEAQSVDDQLASLRSWAARENREVVAELRDDGISASRFGRGKTRADWQIALELVSTGQTDELAVTAIARGTRDRAVWAALLAACIDNHVMLVVDGRVHDPADPDDGFVLDLHAALAVRGAAVISKDVRRAVASRAARGAPHGRVHWGFRIEYDPTTGKPVRRVIDPVQGPIVREVAGRLLAGESAWSVSKDLNDRGLTTGTGKPWLGTNLVRRMQSPSLAGLRVHRGEVLDVEAAWEPILTVEEHHRLRALFADPSRTRNKEGTRVKYLGSGIYECGVCSAPLRMVVGNRPNGTRRARYTCRSGFHVQRAVEPLDLLVETTIVEYLSRPDVLAELHDDGDDPEVQAASAEVARLQAQLAEARDLVSADAISLTDFAAFRARWEPQLARAEQRARPKWLPSAVLEVAGPDAAARWSATPLHGRRAIVKALVTVRVHRAARGNDKTPFDIDSIEITSKRGSAMTR